MALNVWTFTGNLGRDAEQKFLGNGTSVVTFSVGVQSGFGDKAKTTWPRCSMFGDRGSKVLDYLKKGQLVGVTGEVTMNEYTNKEGIKQSSLEVRVNDLTLLGKRQDGQHTEQKTSNSASKSAQSGSFDDIESDVPF
jgi:single-strand DNA-binding protein